MNFTTGFTYRNLHGFARFPGDSTVLVCFAFACPAFSCPAFSAPPTQLIDTERDYYFEVNSVFHPSGVG